MRRFCLTVAAIALIVNVRAFAQAQDPTTYRLTGTRIAFGQDIRVERDEEVSEAVVVVGGSATIGAMAATVKQNLRISTSPSSYGTKEGIRRFRAAPRQSAVRRWRQSPRPTLYPRRFP